MYVLKPFGGEGGGFAKGDKIRIGCLTPAFWGATSGRKYYVTPAILGIPKQRGTKSELAA